MTEITLQEFRDRMSEHLARVEEDREELVVTRADHEPLVVMALAELRSLRETLHLLSTPANAERLTRSIDELEAGEGIERELAPH